ncbi:tRNA uridine-5-carboxymethylaminomethyl(34) synthesis GTPase MnmE [Novosphingobium sp. TH158]|uniref:tRNA uridine-5-carboxymethylaminomethyl(34) synthesis GTPase MnmE n=1 Tax=Novosphingobium sp. TH158 TaxID=2067455 RepID=UPI000C7ADA1C|nr:tRNA uridine-5-carboxymethylaminomethyl(34) synthesis GTPase MnmE [Novosphingobium sp. TH158]PLK27209.1 tRNA uridine-5-carboxymethylaminomethyl(34) synthesis GTPase MnmE [Novosphingobium sp. TH158]
MSDTIFALSSGSPPAAIGVVRVTGPGAGNALRSLTGTMPEPRRAGTARLIDGEGEEIDHALVLWMPGPNTATGEDVAEFHVHGGRAVVAALESALGDLPGLRLAEPGEFTRRAFANGRIDLAEAEGLADLLSAETELQRRSAVAMAGGSFSRVIDSWRERLLMVSASLEAVLDFSDEDDVALLPPEFPREIEGLQAEIGQWLSRPRAETLREGFRVVIAGPPNLGKSTLFNALVESDAAITTPIAGTTRDVLTRPVAIEGIPFLFADTAGLHDAVDDEIEAIGIERAMEALDRADLVLWLGPEGMGPEGAWDIASQIDREDALGKSNPRHCISARTGEGMDALRQDLVATARKALPLPGEAALNERQHRLLTQAARSLGEARHEADPLLAAEGLRQARLAFDSLLGRTTTEDMLDALFGRFCIGK